MSADPRETRMTILLGKVWADPSASPLKVRRLAQSKTLAEVAGAAGVARSTVIRAEAGQTVRAGTWDKLAAALGVARSEIAGDITAPWERTA